MTSKTDPSEASHWEAYWRAPDAGAAVSGDAPGDLFNAVWRQFLHAEMSPRDAARLADIACGAGVVLDRAADYARETQYRMRLVGVDYAQAAALAVDKKPPVSGARVAGVAASAAALPFRTGAFDLVVSQFGIEYAGPGAFDEAARILAAGGAGLFILHCKDGGIDRECAANRAVLAAIEASGLFDTALRAFDAPDVGAPEQEIGAIAQALAANLGGEPLAAKHLLARLAPDVVRLVVRRGAYAPGDARAWLLGMQNEVRLYEARMRAMNEAALSEEAVAAAGAAMAGQGVIVDAPALLYVDGKPAPAAWRLPFRRPA